MVRVEEYFAFYGPKENEHEKQGNDRLLLEIAWVVIANKKNLIYIILLKLLIKL